VPNNGSDNMLGLLVSPRAVAAFFREHRFDVIHVHEPLNPTLSYWAVWATRQLPHVATFHAYAESEPNMLGWARKASGSTIFPFFQRAIAVSEPAARYAARAWRGPLSIIPNGVSTRTFTPGASRRSEAVRLLFVGRLGDRRKGARFLFDAYHGLIAKGHAVTLDVVGELGGAPPPPALPGLRYHGAVANGRLAELYRQCDVFVAPSTGQESFGIVLLEAMASGKPLVCSDIDGYREVARGTSAVLVPPGDAHSLETALAYLVQLDRGALARMGALNRPVAEAFDWDRIAERVRGEYVAAIRSAETMRTTG
jgi:phosphatidylinositol alpha-mannosyltransferase